MYHKFTYDKEKNASLKATRGVCFDDVIMAINNDKILDIIPHHNNKKYPNQMILIVEINEYVYLAPYVEQENTFTLKTVFPSRKFTKIYLGGIKS